MPLEYLLFSGYLVAFSWLITRIRFLQAPGLSNPQLVILFLLKVIAGIFYGWVGIYYSQLAQMSDTWNYHYAAMEEYAILKTDPFEWSVNILRNDYPGGFSNFFGSENSWWNDLKSNVFIKLVSLFDLFSGGSYYVNVIFYSFIVFFGPLALYRVFYNLVPGRRVPVIIGVFLIPSFLYWPSGLHKEGLIFLGICLIIHAIYFANREGRYRVVHYLQLAGGLLLLLLLRNFVLALILPALLAWLLANRFPRYGIAIFCGVYLLAILLFFLSPVLTPALDLPAAVIEKQRAFLQLSGHSSIPVKSLQPTPGSFLLLLPQAVKLSLLRPYPSDIMHLLSMAAAIEIDVLLLMVLLFLFIRAPAPIRSRNCLLFCLFFSASLLVSIGFSVNNLGAIVRYRSIVLPLLMTPMIAQTNWQKIFGYLSGKGNARENT